MRNDTTIRRIRLAVFSLILAGALGACDDQPMAVEEPYSVDMDETTGDATGECVIVNGQVFCP